MECASRAAFRYSPFFYDFMISFFFHLFLDQRILSASLLLVSRLSLVGRAGSPHSAAPGTAAQGISASPRLFGEQNELPKAFGK